VSQRLDRREMLRLALLCGAGAAAASARAQDPDSKRRLGDVGYFEVIDPPAIPLRAFGRTGRKLPMLGLGCFPLGNLGAEEAAVAIVRHALESGARYFDTAPSYNDGTSERRLGKGLKGFAREELYVATKTLERDGDAALAELERSLGRLGLDYVDCVQVHEVHEDVESVFKKGGVLEALLKAREQKKLRGIGFTCHRDPKYALQLLERHDFVSALVPLNAIDVQHLSFVKDFLPKAKEKGVAVVAMKIYAGGALLKEGSKVTAGELVRWALYQEGVSLAVPGAETLAHWDEARAAAVLPDPSQALLDDIAKRVGEHQGKASEWYKDP
jgi:aryl-alcohol dehydrogenase-like predicted oxidoreductase